MQTRIDEIKKFFKEGSVYIHMKRDAQKAIQAFTKANKLLTEIATEASEFAEDLPKFAKCIHEHLAFSHFYSGDFNEARKTIEDIQILHKESYISAIVEGHILYNEQDYQSAREAYDTAICMLEKSQDKTELFWLAIAQRGLGYALFRAAQTSDEKEEMNEQALTAFTAALSIYEDSGVECLEYAIAKHGYARLLKQLGKGENVEALLLEALVMAIRSCENEHDNYDVAIIKRSYAEALLNNGRAICHNTAVKYLAEALATQMKVYQNIPHQSILGTMEIIVDTYARLPQNKALSDMIPKIKAYLLNWDQLVASNKDMQRINVDIAHLKINKMLETINKTSYKYPQQFSFWNQMNLQKGTMLATAAVVSGAIAYSYYTNRR